MAAMKIQDGALVTSCDVAAEVIFISRRLISGVSFISISSIALRNGWGRLTLPPQSRDGQKSPVWIGLTKFETISDLRFVSVNQS